MCNNVFTVTPPLAVSVSETECVVTTQVRPLGLPTSTAAETYIHYLEVEFMAYNMKNSGRFRVCLCLKISTYPAFCRRKYGHLDVIRNTAQTSTQPAFNLLWTHAQRASMLYFADVFFFFFYARLSWPNG